MKQTWRWFGPNDKVTVNDMLQAGVEGVVTGLYDLPPGQLWTRNAISARKAQLATMSNSLPSGLQWNVVESLPVSEAIKTRTGDYQAHLDTYCQSLENLAAEGINVVCYNFMPVLDWTRTDIAMLLPNGGFCMKYDLVDFAMFDIHILARDSADKTYEIDVVEAAEKRFKNCSSDQRQRLIKTIIAGLPGAAQTFTLEQFRQALAIYKGIDHNQLRQHLKAFLEAVIPTAERLGIKLCCHPDDPPWPVLGLPRIVSTEADIAWFINAVDSAANGLTFCSGSLGANGENDLSGIVKRFADRIHFVHLRNVRRQKDSGPGSFFEDTHLGGSTDMINLLQTFLTTHPGYKTLPMRPDHGQDILTDIGTNTTPGYPLCGRMRGLAELRGAMLALEVVSRIPNE